jgi:hypothetical protein
MNAKMEDCEGLMPWSREGSHEVSLTACLLSTAHFPNINEIRAFVYPGAIAQEDEKGMQEGFARATPSLLHTGAGGLDCWGVR